MNIEQWAGIRRKVLVDGRSKRSVMSEEGLHWETLQKILSHSRPPGYRRVKKRGRKIDAHVEWIRQVLDADRGVRVRVVTVRNESSIGSKPNGAMKAATPW